MERSIMFLVPFTSEVLLRIACWDLTRLIVVWRISSSGCTAVTCDDGNLCRAA